ncbi:T9SS type B sorting domain-containing protein [Pedobacter jamesrossensis]|uniref:Gliding motility-associated C-terminal domain-containing protein n=1 Tax=Pedobacter jamesrossensis TaxID=1908238 RepID=A0ABV8NJT3_9SPHI
MSVFSIVIYILLTGGGKEIFKRRKYKNDWTGEGLEEGNYYYLLMIKESEDSEWKTFKGYVTLLRANQ